jgi:hypothetical protein
VIKEKLKLVTEKFSESWAACMCMMVQGDLSVLTLNHALTASKVGILTGVAMLVASFLPWNNKWLGIFLTGAFTALADSLVHMAMFPYESLATGAGAMLLAIVFEKTFKKNL